MIDTPRDAAAGASGPRSPPDVAGPRREGPGTGPIAVVSTIYDREWEAPAPGHRPERGWPSDALPLLTTNLAPQTPTPRPPEQGLFGGDNLDEVV